MITYKDAGVNKEEGYKTVENIKDAVKSTYNPNVLSELGSFGAFYKLPTYKKPVLVSGTDGVGTKLKIAFEVEKYDTIGIDCFAMCANDILCHGAKPLFFLDYLACGKLEAKVASEIISGMVWACKQTKTALIGGETAEMPGFYKAGEYDIAGFCVGIVEEDEIINGSKIQEGDVILGLPSSGLHSNGFSLVRKLIVDFNETFEGKPFYETLLEPTRLYINEIHTLLEANITINGIAHITGGGLIENVPRIIPDGLCASISRNNIPKQPIFDYLQSKGNISTDEMFGTFNMGVGMVMITDAENAKKIMQTEDNQAFELGKVTTETVKIKWNE